jgi:hypothetical protein
MPQYIVLRLLPPAAVDQATFNSYLNGLTINVYDVSYADANTVGPPTVPPLGAAQYVGPIFPPNPATGIVQHATLPFGIPPLSVATAVVEYVPPGPEYITPDLRIEFVLAGTPYSFDSQLYYDVPLYFSALPITPADYQGIADTSVSAFVTIPPALNPNAVSLALPANGYPPNYTELLNAVWAVLAQDPGGVPPPPGVPPPAVLALIAGLSADQCTNIAYEIVYGPQAPLPQPPDALENLFTDPPNSGTYTDPNEQNRLMFEGKLSAYYGPNDAVALQIANYVYSLSAAVYCEQQTQLAAAALVEFPVNPNAAPPPTLTTITEAQIIFTGIGVAVPAVDVPAGYFYALSSQMSLQVTKVQRYQSALDAGQQQNLASLASAINAGWISVDAAMNPAQAVRILDALNIPSGSTVTPWPLANPSAAQIWGDWILFPPLWTAYQVGDDLTIFWPAEAAGVTAAAFLDMVLFALTQAFEIQPGAHFLAAEIIAYFGFANVVQVPNVSPTQWQTFFEALPPTLAPPVTTDDILPPFTLPGDTNARVAAFIGYVQQFFQMAVALPPLFGAPGLGGSEGFGWPAYDIIAETIKAYPGFAFGAALVRAILEAAAAAVVPGDPEVQAWAVQAVWTINELFFLSTLGEPVALQFSIMEALFARGFTSREEVLDLPPDDFQQALTGTVAYDFAAAIYAHAGVAHVFPPPPPPGFRPINPCCLTDCIPPLYLSPLGPVEYLHEMLKVSERSTCEHPFAPPAPGHTTLQARIDARRGPVETLAVTRANLETPLPLIDLVNECLQYMASTNPITKNGQVYNTSEDALAGHKLCAGDCCEDQDHHHHEHDDQDHCHRPVPLFGALPEYSTPATPVAANSAVVPAVWNTLRNNFSTCCLPYDQALDVSRTYLEHLRSCRYEEMRTFRKCITEFVLDPVNQPADFLTYLWRYPVRIDIAIEYLGISREEYMTLFEGVWPRECGRQDRPLPRQPSPSVPPWILYGFPSEEINGVAWTNIVVRLPEFLKRTCLTYCEFVELWKCAPVRFYNGADRARGFPDCEPCCLDDLWLVFPGENSANALWELGVFIRLWRKLQHICGANYSFCQLADICTVLHFPGPDFIRQLAAFQMLRDQLRLKLSGGEAAAGATGADRTWLLALWVGPAAKHWQWALHQLIEGIAYHARCRHECHHRGPEFLKLLPANFDALSRLAGFDPSTASDTWHAAPTHTLRFAEILAKIYASNFGIGEILFLFTADPHLEGEDPFPLQDEDEAAEMPLGLPEEEREHSLWELRRKLLHISISDEEAGHWTWGRMASTLTREFGFDAPDVEALGEHFFAETLESQGHPVSAQAQRFSADLAVTTPHMWNTPPEGPFHYDTAALKLWAVLPLSDEHVLAQLIRVQALKPPEQQAVQDVYFQPRAMLSTFSLLFSNFGEAEHRLIQEKDPKERWRYFQRQFALCHARCRAIAEHLSSHVDAATHQKHPDGVETAMLLLKHLHADENFATSPWENDDGRPPKVTWTPPPHGGAFAALLGLTGTGIHGEFTAGGKLVWREVRPSMSAFGAERDRDNSPVPTLIPSMGLTLTPQQMRSVTVRNGFAMQDSRGRWLGGAEGFQVTWHGVLLIEDEGEYRFFAGAPSREHEAPDVEAAQHRSWNVVLKRGQKTWRLLRHRWHGEEDLRSEPLQLKRGAYELTVEFVQHSPNYLGSEEVHPEHTGFEIKYSGPDSQHKLVAVPHRHLFRVDKDSTLAVPGLAGWPATFLSRFYTSTLRDIRRTYQRAFKALLFSHRFALSARPHAGEGSELGYMLERRQRFMGRSCYRNAGIFTTHRADFDFDFLPVRDEYHSPAADMRAHPTPKRIQAMFDWWERIFDYDMVRKDVFARSQRHLWLLFAEAFEKQPADPDSLLRHMGADARHWPLDLHFFQDQGSPIYAVTSQDLEDDRWLVRAWHADRWLCRLWQRFTVQDMTKARPDLWASDDPSAPVFLAGPQTGNANLLQFVCNGCFENGVPRRYEDIERLNDGLRERGREALISYLCGPNGIVHTSKELSGILLLDVRCGLREKASRIEEAISAVQIYILRSRLGLEPLWGVDKAFAHLWDSRFVSFHVWQACKRRELYKENWVEWHELEKAEKVEAFRFLNEELKRVTLTIAEPGGVDYWPNHRPAMHPSLCLLQHRDPAEMQILPAPREGLNLLARPERDARPSWITDVPALAAPQLPGTRVPPAPAPALKLPFWIECAIRLGAQFVRLAASAYPPASTEFEPWHKCQDGLESSRKDPEKKDDCCVSCCPECGCENPAHIDEYWFWLIDAQYFAPQTQPVYSGNFDGEQIEYYNQTTQVATPWHDPTQLPGMLEWPPEPMVRLAWCRVHNGEFQQPRRSVWGVPVVSGATPDLSLQGRVLDSLYFSVSDSVTGTGGFRYDMVPDVALETGNLVLPAPPPLATPPLPPGLAGYPYFAYFRPGARLFPWHLFSPTVAVAHALRAHCRFEAALKWYDVVYNPFDRDNRWAKCETKEAPPVKPNPPPVGTVPTTEIALPPKRDHDHNCCCDTTDIPCYEARDRSILLHYLDTLLEWGDALMRRNSPEQFQQASLLFETMRKIMGPHPAMVKNPAKVNQTVATFQALHAPINPRLMMLYDRLDDRVALIHNFESARRLREDRERHDAQYWGDDPVRDGWRSAVSLCCDADGWCHLHSPYRFTFLIQKAKELAAQVRELGALLLSAFEKGDTEFLASVRARHERELALLGRKVREDEWRDADWQVQALEKSKAADQASRIYYANLIANGLNANEQGYLNEMGISNASRTAANVMEAIAEGMDVVPDVFVGTVDYVQIPVGTKLAGLFKTLARVSNTLADIASTSAAVDLTQAGWDRRLQEWVHQVQILDIEIEQMELQILGAERRRHAALRTLDTQERQIEQTTEVLDILRDKFTNHALYLFLQKHTTDLYYQTYELALRAARQAERAFNFERGHTTHKFIACEHWDNLHEGLLAGEKLQLDLARMEHEYCDLNRREYELAKHISLRTQFPREFLRLKETGECEIEIHEWMFDLDYPGQYMRRLKSVSLTIPCVSGPYNEVHCRLTLLRSTTRIDPLLTPPPALCCHCEKTGNGYQACPHDPRVVREYGATEAIATSTGQNDAGLFEVTFHDERYLPFEFRGAVSRWRIEMPRENNYFAMDTLTDVIVNLNYTSREGGDRLRRAAREAAAHDLPGEGWCLFDIRHDFADAWELFRRECHDRDRHEPESHHEGEGRHGRERHGGEERRLILPLSRSMFPFVPGDRELHVEKMALFFDGCEHCHCECPGECSCCVNPEPARHQIELERGNGREPQRFQCVLSDHWPGLYHGQVETRIGPLHPRKRTEARFRFPEDACCITRAYLLCRYDLEERCPRRKEPPPLRCNPCD